MHVYYDPASRDRAGQLRTWVEERFPVRMGRWHDVPVGPHPTAMYQIQFTTDLFPALVPFVMMNRMGLTVLLHPESGRPRDDHTLQRHLDGRGAAVEDGCAAGNRLIVVCSPSRSRCSAAIANLYAFNRKSPALVGLLFSAGVVNLCLG